MTFSTMRNLVAGISGIALAACAGSGHGSEAEAAATDALSCATPAEWGDSAAKLLARFKDDARLEKVEVMGGDVSEALVLFPDDESRRLEFFFWDKKKTLISEIRAKYPASAWSMAGQRIGDSVEKAEQANGRPFAISGFEWDYGGYIQDFNAGKLTYLPGDCYLSLRFEMMKVGDEPPVSLLGDITVQSNDPVLRETQPQVMETTLGWPAPEDFDPETM